MTKTRGKCIFLQWNYTFLCEFLFYLHRTSMDAFSKKEKIITNDFKVQICNAKVLQAQSLMAWGLLFLLGKDFSFSCSTGMTMALEFLACGES